MRRLFAIRTGPVKGIEYCMKPSEALAVHRDEILTIVSACKFTNARIFGSFARGEDTQQSDLDILVDVAIPETATFLDLGRLKHQVQKLTGFEVDIVIERSIDGHFRDEVLRDAKLI
jgi:predicted nucleotidyltransferase